MQNSKQNNLERILRNPKTVFSAKELLLLCEGTSPDNLRSQLSYYVSTGSLYRVRRGLYAKDKNYDRLEVATQILTPAYISFETVLRQAGAIFQYYESIFVASTHSREIVCDGQSYIYRRLRDTLLNNRAGIKIQDTYSIATPERAFLDLVYLNPDYYLDKPSQINWQLVHEMVPIYENKRMEKVVDEHIAEYKQNLEVSQ